MKNRFWLFKRGRTFYLEDSVTRKQESLRTTDRREAVRLRDARNESSQTPMLGLALARAYLATHDARIAKRHWSEVMAELASHGGEGTQVRCRREMQSKPYDLIRDKPIIETTSEDFLAVLRSGGNSTNHFLRRLHNLALGLGWLPWPILASKLWPKLKSKIKRAISVAEHQRIIDAEKNEERRLFYELLWEIGASQTDAATLTGVNINWTKHTLTYARHKTGQVACIRIGDRLRCILMQLPDTGPLFPRIASLKDTDRAGEFRRRCRMLDIRGVTLHSYRYAWAERAKSSGYPERWAQSALGHNSRAIHEAYAKEAKVICPSLEEYEKATAERKIIPIKPTEVLAIGTTATDASTGAG